MKQGAYPMGKSDTRNPSVCGECQYNHFNTGGMIYGCLKGQLANGWPQEKVDCKKYRKKYTRQVKD